MSFNRLMQVLFTVAAFAMVYFSESVYRSSAVIVLYTAFTLWNIFVLTTEEPKKGAPANTLPKVVEAPIDLSHLEDGISKILGYQETQIQALDYVVGFIRSYQDLQLRNAKP